jgi:hypothetical protein
MSSLARSWRFSVMLKKNRSAVAATLAVPTDVPIVMFVAAASSRPTSSGLRTRPASLAACPFASFLNRPAVHVPSPRRNLKGRCVQLLYLRRESARGGGRVKTQAFNLPRRKSSSISSV